MQKSVAVALDRTQNRMLALLIPSQRLPGEDLDSYCRRRARTANRAGAAGGHWSTLWAKRVVSWQDHLDRHPEHLCSRLLKVQDANWLQHRRAQYVGSGMSAGRNTPSAGRTGTRCTGGRPQKRWDESIAVCKTMLNDHGSMPNANTNSSIQNILTSAMLHIRNLVNNSQGESNGRNV